MIDYAVTMLANGMNENEPKRAYAYLQSRGTLTIDELADHMVSHGCNYDRGDIIAVIIKLVGCTKELLLDGYRVQLGDLGQLYLSCKSKGAENAEKFTTNHITSINVNLRASKQYADMAQRVSLHRVPTRRAQAATLKAQIEGGTTADWSNINDDEDDGE